MGQVDFLPFCGTTSGTNLPAQSDYITNTNRTQGNQPGIASSKYSNKPLRQATAITSQLAQFISNSNGGVDVIDQDDMSNVLSLITGSLLRIAPVFTPLTSGTGTFFLRYIFFLESANATAGATYSNNGQTFTVVNTISAGSQIVMTATGNPTANGVLTLVTGTGDSTINFFMYRKPVALEVKLLGGGSGGGGSGTSGYGSGQNGGDSTFGTLTASGAVGGTVGTGAVGGLFTIGSGWDSGQGFYGSDGGGSNDIGTGSPLLGGGVGGAGPFGGNGVSGYDAASAAKDNSGAGGAGGAAGSAGVGTGPGGSSGGYIIAYASGSNLLSSYPYGIGAGGPGGTPGASGTPGTTGGSGVALLMQLYQ